MVSCANLIYIWLKPQRLKLTKISPERQACCQIKEIDWSWYSSLGFQAYSWDPWFLAWAVWNDPEGFKDDGRFSCWIFKEGSWCRVGSVPISGDDPWISEASSKLTIIILALHIIKCICQWWSKVHVWLPAVVIPQSRMTNTVMIIRLWLVPLKIRYIWNKSENWICPSLFKNLSNTYSVC